MQPYYASIIYMQALGLLVEVPIFAHVPASYFVTKLGFCLPVHIYLEIQRGFAVVA